MEKCGGGVRKCVGVWGEVGCVEKCGEGRVCGKMWGRCGKVFWVWQKVKRGVWEKVKKGVGKCIGVQGK